MQPTVPQRAAPTLANVNPPTPGPLHAEHLGDGDPLVLLHGFTQTAQCWGPFAERLATHHALTLLDLPGHGDSADVRADLPLTAELAADAGGRGTWIGYSLGGRVALHVALQRPEVVDRLVIIGATGGLDDSSERAARRSADEILADHIEDVGTDAFLAEWLAQPLFAGLDDDSSCIARRRRNTPAGLASSLRLCGTGTQESLWSRLSEISVPTLVIVGALDSKFTEIGRRLVDAIGGNAQLRVIDDAGHSAQLERPEATADAIETWLISRR